jgi:hypothetical protein
MLNGTHIADVFAGIGRDCPNEADRDRLFIPAAQFNDLVAGGDATFTFTGTPVVDTALCGANNFVAMSINYRTVVPDTDHNGIIDHCENCQIADAPLEESALPLPRNRYLSFIPENPGRLVALRFLAASLPDELADGIAEPMWVDVPWKTTPDRQAFARLTCQQVFHDWSAYAMVHVADDEIVPRSRYEIRSLDFACARGDAAPEAMLAPPHFESEPIDISTAVAWGDLDANATDSVSVNAKDIALAVDILRNPSHPLRIATADVQPAIPDGRVDARDVAAVVDAAKGRSYPFTIQCQCCDP